MNRRIIARWRFAWLACFALELGCAGELVPVSGHVEWQGKPLERGMVMFHPETAERGGVGVGVITEGTYSIRTGAQNGIHPGAYRVTVAEFTSPASSVAGPFPVLLTPLQYSRPTTTPLRHTVPKRGSVFNIVLEKN